jgi:hypothetical protein
MRFTVIDKNTGEYPDLREIALNEDWADGLVCCDMQGFALEEDGSLILQDEYGNFRYCPSDRFEIVFEEGELVSLTAENAELKARLEKAVELPCKVGDVVYESNIDRNIVSTYTIKKISIFQYGTRYDWELIDGIYSNVNGFYDIALGKTIFLSKDQAEAKLKEIKEKSL